MTRSAILLSSIILFGIVAFNSVTAHENQPTTTPALASASTEIPATQPLALIPTTEPSTRPAEQQFKIVRGRESFWRLVEDQSGTWWFMSPSGSLEFMNTVTTVQPYQAAREKVSAHYVSRDWDGTPTHPGNLHRWADLTAKRVQSMGFKGLGAWCNPEFHNVVIPMTRDLNVWSWMNTAAKRFYNPDWDKTADHAIKAQVELLKENHNLVGYFIDNELDWGDGFAGPGVYFDHLAVDDPNRAQVMHVIETVWSTVEKFNADWNTHFKEWKDLDAWTDLPHEPAGAYDRLSSAWLSHLAEDYFRTSTALIHKYDPNHLILGVRFRGWAPKEVCRASRGYTDAQSLNYYVADAKLDLEMFRSMYEESNQPIVISEYSFHALDGRSGDRDTVGFAGQVLDQQARADGYRLFTERLARVPYVIGADWFQWNDEPPSGRSGDGEDVNFGVVDVDDRPYQRLVSAIKETAAQLNPLHAKSATDEQKDVWRESFAAKPLMHVPYLNDPPTLNGELSDWVPQSKISGVRHAETVGLERSPIPMPNVYLGWTKDGLYVGMEVFDNDISGAPAKGWWWTKDFVEFWLSTRPVASDETNYNPYCHQFFFVPNEFPADDGVLGTVGQWHRDGDALHDNLIPHPEVQDAVRILPDRYVVEMFIPAKALHGYDPAAQPAMAFNIHVRNYQHALDYFWSAPKEVMTQLHPNTWGTLYLDPPMKEKTASAMKPMPAEATADVSAAMRQ